MKRIIWIFWVFLLLLPLSGFAEYQPGEHVADFQLPDSYGNLVNLYDYSDYIVILPFWEVG